MASLSPIDMLSLGGGEQELLRCLTRWPQLTLVELAERMRTPPAEVERLVNRLLADSRLVEQLQNERRVFSIRFRFRQTGVRNMPQALLDLLSRSSENFLQKLPLTASLPAEATEQLQQLAQRHTLVTNEVLSWQGHRPDHVHLIENGLLSQTRLNGRQTGQKTGYARRGHWLGLVETLAGAAADHTYTAVTDTTILAWQAHDFFDFAHRYPAFALALSREMGRRLHACQQARERGRGRLWAVEGTEARAGVTLLVTALAQLAQESARDRQVRVLLWWREERLPSLPFWRKAQPAQERSVAGLAQIWTLQNGLEVLTRPAHHELPLQVQLDILLGELLAQYDYIICDTGHQMNNELLLQLRGRAQTLITLTTDPQGAEAGVERWRELQAYSAPDQKRVLALNQATIAMAEADPRFQLVIPADAQVAARPAHQTAALPDAGPLHEALHEIFRRLSLTHALAIFVPSTLDVDQQVDNQQQVQSALAFFGHVFGGATSSNADGVWRSEESGLVAEQVTIVRTFVSRRALDEHLDRVIDFATELKRDMKQEAVALSVDNELLLV